MTREEAIKLANDMAFMASIWVDDEGNEVNDLVKFAKLVEAKVESRYMQLFLDPENQPTQFGTATQEYREKEVKEVQDLLTDLAHHVRTKHLYGMEVQKMLEKEAAIRARGEA